LEQGLVVAIARGAVWGGDGELFSAMCGGGFGFRPRRRLRWAWSSSYSSAEYFHIQRCWVHCRCSRLARLRSHTQGMETLLSMFAFRVQLVAKANPTAHLVLFTGASCVERLCYSIEGNANHLVRF
jgi:hypothetical protein